MFWWWRKKTGVLPFPEGELIKFVRTNRELRSLLLASNFELPHSRVVFSTNLLLILIKIKIKVSASFEKTPQQGTKCERDGEPTSYQ